jgi:hypothetical protein
MSCVWLRSFTSAISDGHLVPATCQLAPERLTLSQDLIPSLPETRGHLATSVTALVAIGLGYVCQSQLCHFGVETDFLPGFTLRSLPHCTHHPLCFLRGSSRLHGTSQGLLGTQRIQLVSLGFRVLMVVWVSALMQLRRAFESVADGGVWRSGA